MKKFIIPLLIVLSACGPAPRDYDASAACTDEGYKAGTPEYEDCVKKEHAAALLKQQEEQYDVQQQQEQEQKSYRVLQPPVAR